ncbi:MAG TPA: phage baseplate assembly protein V [Methanosarcina sp.]|nr:phage baseplate assembly protein V [Methanosarcina sp.]
MASNQIRRSGANPTMKADGKKSGFTIDPGPYEAIVQGYVKGSRMGQLIVTVPEWSGLAGHDTDHLVVSYASPFFGATLNANAGTNPDNHFQNGQSYGFWFVPPDIGNKVLVTFVAGDISRGYWFACVYDTPLHHMVPANGRNVGGPKNVSALPDQYKLSGINDNSVLPVIEFNIADPMAFTANGIVNTKRNPQVIQSSILINQGLDQDKVRGAISSSSLRECPSNVYGISTPGRSATPTDQVKGKPGATYFRTGGHTFVMDDGADGTGADPVGTDQLMRLRTAGGHQLLMNDTENILYIANATGDQWLEFSNDGAINVYGKGGFNLRSTGAINMHSETAINMCSPIIGLTALKSATVANPEIRINSTGLIDMNATTKFGLKADSGISMSSIATVDLVSTGTMTVGSQGKTAIKAGGTLVLSGATAQLDGGMLYLNSNSGNIGDLPAAPQAVKAPVTKVLPDTKFDGKNYKNNGTTLESTCTVVPAHEPWVSVSNGKIGISRPKV